MAPRKGAKKSAKTTKTKSSATKSQVLKPKTDWNSVLTADEYNDRVLEGVDDEEVDSDVDCFDSEDEMMYGSLFSSREREGDDSGEEDDSDDDSNASDDSDDSDEEVRMGKKRKMKSNARRERLMRTMDLSSCKH